MTLFLEGLVQRLKKHILIMKETALTSPHLAPPGSCDTAWQVMSGRFAECPECARVPIAPTKKLKMFVTTCTRYEEIIERNCAPGQYPFLKRRQSSGAQKTLEKALKEYTHMNITVQETNQLIRAHAQNRKTGMHRHNVQASVEIVLVENFLQHCRQLPNLRRTTHTRPWQTT